MKYTESDKRSLYESIMRDVAKSIKKHLNESMEETSVKMSVSFNYRPFKKGISGYFRFTIHSEAKENAYMAARILNALNNPYMIAFSFIEPNLSKSNYEYISMAHEIRDDIEKQFDLDKIITNDYYKNIYFIKQLIKTVCDKCGCTCMYRVDD